MDYKNCLAHILYGSANSSIITCPFQNKYHLLLPAILKSSTSSTIRFIKTSLSLSTHVHLNKKCSTTSTSPELHWVQILSSCFIPTHLPVSTHSTTVPPLSLDRMRLIPFLSTCAHLALPPPSKRFCNTLKFDLAFLSLSHPLLLHHLPCTILQQRLYSNCTYIKCK